MPKVNLLSLILITTLLSTAVVAIEADKDEKIIKINQKSVKAKIFGGDKSVCQQFLKDYDFDKKVLNHPLEWVKVSEDQLADPVEDYGWISYIDLYIDSSKTQNRFYKTISNFHGVKSAVSIDVVDSNKKIEEKLSLSSLSKNALWSDSAYAEKSQREKASSYNGLAFQLISKKEPYIFKRNVYLFFSDEFLPVKERDYLLLRMDKIGDEINSIESCYIKFN
jgi:hypothetical protein